jgi:glycosyltransferase involved in cell wall biosynthesis
MKVLVFVDWFFPGYKAGGQISSCLNIVYALQKEPINIYIITRDRDLDDADPYPGLPVDSWTVFQEGTKIMYLTPASVTYSNIRRLISEVNADSIYLNSMFSYKFTMLPLLAAKRLSVNGKIIIAPRGMLQQGALQFKKYKKRIALSALFYTGLLRKVIFHATDEREVIDINKNIGGRPVVKMVYDFPTTHQNEFQYLQKKHQLKCLFVSRVVEKKNLLFLLQVLAEVHHPTELTVAGPIENKEYWNACLKQINALPPHCKVHYIGAVQPRQLNKLYQEHHLFVLPTFGENFGHVIFDAFINGRPVLISDQTPWKELEAKQVGFDIALSEKETYAKKIDFFSTMEEKDYHTWCQNAWQFAADRIGQLTELKEQYKSLFN